MALTVGQTRKSPAYRLGAFALLAATAAIAAAWGFEIIGGYMPCPLCLMQRWAYYAGVPALFVALILLTSERQRAAGLLFLLVSLAFLSNAGLGVYHAGAEWKFWDGPSTCAGGGAAVAATAGDLLKNLAETRVVRCDEAQLRIFGLSFAGWNVVASFVLAMAALRAAFAADDPLD